jgi:hypothetical protein
MRFHRNIISVVLRNLQYLLRSDGLWHRRPLQDRRVLHVQKGISYMFFTVVEIKFCILTKLKWNIACSERLRWSSTCPATRRLFLYIQVKLCIFHMIDVKMCMFRKVFVQFCMFRKLMVHVLSIRLIYSRSLAHHECGIIWSQSCVKVLLEQKRGSRQISCLDIPQT